MKIFGAIMMAVLMISLIAMPGVLAEEVTDVDTPEDAVADSVVEDIDDEITESMNEDVSGAKIGWKRLGLLFTFNQETKAKKELDLARLRLIQARNAAKNNNTEAMENAIQAHNRLLERVQERVNALEGNGDIEGVREMATKLVGLERAIEVHEARIAKVNEMLENEDLTEEQRALIEEKMGKAETVTSKLKELEAAKKEKLKTRLMAVGDLTEEEVEAEIEELEDEQNIRAINQVTARARVNQAEKVVERLEKRIVEAEARGQDVSVAKERLSEIQSSVTEARSQYESGQYMGSILTIREKAKQSRAEIRQETRTQIQENLQAGQDDTDNDSEDADVDEDTDSSNGQQIQGE